VLVVVYRKSRQVHEPQKDLKDSEPAQKPQAALKLTDQYIALLIRVFSDAGLLDVRIRSFLVILNLPMFSKALLSMCKESTTGTNLSRKATLLMAELLHIANKVLPLSVAARLQVTTLFTTIDQILIHFKPKSIPQVFSLAADYEDGEHRIIGTSVFSAINSFNRNRSKLQPTNITDSRPRFGYIICVLSRCLYVPQG
jgi:large subunit ribosomal protein L17e